MLIGLRRSLGDLGPSRRSSPLWRRTVRASPGALFHHESLEVYQVALKLIEWFVARLAGKDPSGRLGRQIDEGLTSIILNIAEGNGRYAELDHRRFLDVAESSAVKVAAYLDLAMQRLSLSPTECDPCKELLRRIVAMLSRM